MINVGDFLERIEMFYLTAWICSIFLRLTILYYAATLGAAQLLRFKDYKPLTLPLGIIIIVLSVLLYENFSVFRDFTSVPVYGSVALPFVTLLPLALLLTEMIRKKGRRCH